MPLRGGRSEVRTWTSHLPRASALFALPRGVAPAHFSPAIFVAFLFTCLAINYPGHLTIDAVVQLIGAADVQYLNDWHSPVVTWLWSLPGGLLGQPAGALLVQSLPLAFYAAVRPSGAFEPTGRAIAALAVEVGFKLALVVWAGVIVKDVLLFGLILAALAAFQLSASSSSNKGRWLILASACLVTALMTRRSNFVSLIGPALILTLLYAREKWLKLAAPALLIAASALLMATTSFIDHRILGASPTWPEKQLVLFDLAGISARTHSNEFQGIPGWPVDRLADPSACYSPQMWDPLSPWGRCSGCSAEYDRIAWKAGTFALVKPWLSAILRNPVPYLAHRTEHLWGALTTNLGNPGEKNPHPFENSTLAVNGAERASELQARTAGRVPPGYFQAAERSVRLRPFTRISKVIVGQRAIGLIAFLVCLGLLVLQLRRKHQERATNPILVLAVSIGVANVTMLWFFGVAASTRYLFPAIVCAYAALLLELQQGTLPGSDRSGVGA